jgi:hypothetical protein
MLMAALLALHPLLDMQLSRANRWQEGSDRALQMLKYARQRSTFLGRNFATCNLATLIR